MIGISKLLCGMKTESDGLRYNDVHGHSVEQIPYQHKNNEKKPIVVWNSTQRCNLNCVHCYASAKTESNPNELTTNDVKLLLEDLAQYKIPVFLFSGGEPLIRDDLFELGAYANQLGIRPVISTNGTLITEKMAQKIKDTGFRYVGVSLDGLHDINDKFRGQDGAFERAIQGIRNLMKVGMKTGIRFTVTKYNQGDLDGLFKLAQEEQIPRFCMYHLDYAGRGKDIQDIDLSHSETRNVVQKLFNLTQKAHSDGENIEVLLVGNYADGVYLYKYIQDFDKAHASNVYQLLRRNGGDGAGERISCIDELGNVHANQFWRDYSFGNVKTRLFSHIWSDLSDPVLSGLRNREQYIKGRCAQCQFFEICRGGSRVRAKAVYEDIWESDPGCYLTDTEISLNEAVMES